MRHMVNVAVCLAILISTHSAQGMSRGTSIILGAGVAVVSVSELKYRQAKKQWSKIVVQEWSFHEQMSLIKAQHNILSDAFNPDKMPEFKSMQFWRRCALISRAQEWHKSANSNI